MMNHKSLFRLFAFGMVVVMLLAGCTAADPVRTATLPPVATPTLTPQPTLTTAPTATLLPSNTAAAPTVETAPQPQTAFDGQRAYQDVLHQLEMGPRVPGSDAHGQAVDWMVSELQASGWEAEVQETSLLDQPIRNVIAKRGSGQPWVIIGAHFDSRMKADQDPDPAKHDQPVPAANDGAAGVAVLLELARVLPEDTPGQVWLAFFDSEDQGELPGWDWILGSRALANSLTGSPDAVIVIDMIGDADLNIYQERNSDPQLTAEIWQVAASLGYGDVFIPQPKFSMLDDHTPFLQKGIRAIDIIDFDYPYWHTTEDTADKVSAQSLQAVGDTLFQWLQLP